MASPRVDLEKWQASLDYYVIEWSLSGNDGRRSLMRALFAGRACISLGLAVFYCAATGYNASALVTLFTGVAALVGICIFAFAAQQEAGSVKYKKSLRSNKNPFWLTGGSIALSNLSVTPAT